MSYEPRTGTLVGAPIGAGFGFLVTKGMEIAESNAPKSFLLLRMLIGAVLGGVAGYSGSTQLQRTTGRAENFFSVGVPTIGMAIAGGVGGAVGGNSARAVNSLDGLILGSSLGNRADYFAQFDHGIPPGVGTPVRQDEGRKLVA